METVKSTGAVMIIIASAKSFWILYDTWKNTTNNYSRSYGYDKHKFVLLMVINLLLLFVGMFIGRAPLVILAPLLVPAKTLGIDPLYILELYL